MSLESLAAFVDAIDGGDLEVVRTLLDESPRLAQARDSAGLSLLLHALYHGQPAIADLLAERRDGGLDFFEAVALGRGDEVKRRLRADASVVGRWSGDGFTPLHYAAFFGHAEIARQLVDRGADVDAEARNPTRVRPLHSAAARGDVQVCRMLLGAGAEPDRRQQGGYTALMSAALHGNRPLADLLLGAGADAAVVSDDGRRAADFARQGEHEELAGELDAASS